MSYKLNKKCSVCGKLITDSNKSGYCKECFKNMAFLEKKILFMVKNIQKKQLIKLRK